MIRVWYIILISLPLILYYLLRCSYVARHADEYTENEKYSIAKRMVNLLKKKGRISTEVFGVDNLPKEGGYVMYPNHQGKYDALGVIYAHDKPCSFVIDKKTAQVILTNEFTMLLDGSRLDKTDPKSQARTILDVANKVKNGRRFFIFPEGQYKDNHNHVEEFKPGAFQCSVRSKAPIVPVALVDSYKPFGINSLRKVKTEVHFLEPLYFQDYKDLSTSEIAEVVRERIVNVIDESINKKVS